MTATLPTAERHCVEVWEGREKIICSNRVYIFFPPHITNSNSNRRGKNIQLGWCGEGCCVCSRDSGGKNIVYIFPPPLGSKSYRVMETLLTRYHAVIAYNSRRKKTSNNFLSLIAAFFMLCLFSLSLDQISPMR